LLYVVLVFPLSSTLPSSYPPPFPPPSRSFPLGYLHCTALLPPILEYTRPNHSTPSFNSQLQFPIPNSQVSLIPFPSPPFFPAYPTTSPFTHPPGLSKARPPRPGRCRFPLISFQRFHYFHDSPCSRPTIEPNLEITNRSSLSALPCTLLAHLPFTPATFSHKEKQFHLGLI
jgi:hypothetical protein